MTKKKKRPKTGGRQKLPEGQKRVALNSKVLPGTHENITKQAAALNKSIGKYLDIIHGKKN